MLPNWSYNYLLLPGCQLIQTDDMYSNMKDYRILFCVNLTLI